MILFLLGIILSSIGLFFIVLYLNLFSLGYNFKDFFQYIISRFEVWLLAVGLLLIFKGTERLIKNELFLRRNSKFSRR